MAIFPTAGTATQRERKRVRIYWHERPPETGLSVIAEFQARGFNAALWLYLAKRGFKKAMIPTLKKISKKLHRNENDALFLRSLFNTASQRGELPNVPMAYVFGSWLDRFDTMGLLNEYTKGWLPADAGPLLKSGEVSSRRGEAVDQYIWMLEQRGIRKKALIKGLSAPVINIIVVLIYFVIIARYIAPGYEQGLPRNRWQGPLRAVGIIADIVNYYTIPLIIALIGFGILVAWSLPNYTGRYRSWLERRTILPFWSMYKQNVGANFMMSYSALNRTSMPENDIVETLMDGAPKYYRSRLAPIRARTSRGSTIPNAMVDTGLDFPDKQIISELLDYQSSDDFPKEIENLAQNWVETSIERMRLTIASIDMFILVLAYSMIALITIADFSYVKQVQRYLSG